MTRLSQRRPTGAIRPPPSHVPVPAISRPMLLARIYKIFPLSSPFCRAPMRIISSITEAAHATRLQAEHGRARLGSDAKV